MCLLFEESRLTCCREAEPVLGSTKALIVAASIGRLTQSHMFDLDRALKLAYGAATLRPVSRRYGSRDHTGKVMQIIKQSLCSEHSWKSKQLSNTKARTSDLQWQIRWAQHPFFPRQILTY